ncbi:MAG: DNA polymerase II [Spirochaetia bacterium]
MDIRGFILHSSYTTGRNPTMIHLVGRCEDGKTFAAIIRNFQPRLYVRRSDYTSSLAALDGKNGYTGAEPVKWKTMDGEEAVPIEFPNYPAFIHALRLLPGKGIRTYESDITPADQFLMSRRIHSAVRIRGEDVPGNHVDRIFMDPELDPEDYEPDLTVLSIDIETDPGTKEIYAVSLFTGFTGRSTDDKGKVLFSGDTLGDARISACENEEKLLRRFAKEVREIDPDIITGWNTTDFDLPVIAERFGFYGIPLLIGRSEEPAKILPPEGKKSAAVIIPGRQALDALRLVRSGPERFTDYTLDTIAEAVVGEKKLIESADGEDKLKQLEELRINNPEKFCLYCLKDSELVIRILERTGLLGLTVKKSRLIGAGIQKAWTSIAAFEYLYTESLHGREMVAPSPGVDAFPVGRAPGGAIIPPRPGLYDDVYLLDFKSLYPSIIRTFNIDPAGFVQAYGAAPGRTDVITAPNGAKFPREQAILPELLDRFFENREASKQAGDPIGSYVYKIVMNSFYGVLGSSGCRFAATELSGAITEFGQMLLRWSKHFLEQLELTVLYGDTDSVFFCCPGESKDREFGTETAEKLNRALERYIRDEYRVEPKLEIEYEKFYLKLFLPAARGGEEGGGKGRAKGYAGLVSPGESGKQPYIEVKGMEAVRSDWTELAHEFQMKLLDMVFRETPVDKITAYLKETRLKLLDGQLDAKLLYTKHLRKPVREYTKTQPPHVKAASLLPPAKQQGRISYFITANGPQPARRLTAPIDYDHYLQRQLKPIAGDFSETLSRTSREKIDLTVKLDGEEQLSLFDQ